MSNLSEIEVAIQQLPPNDLHQLAIWLNDYLEQRWDEQIEADLASGKLNHLIASAEADIAANRVKTLDEVLRHD
jgi:hypothetical protein